MLLFDNRHDGLHQDSNKKVCSELRDGAVMGQKWIRQVFWLSLGVSGRLTAQESRLQSHSSNTVFESLCVVKRQEKREERSHHMESQPHPESVRAGNRKTEFKTDKVRRRNLDVIIKTHSDLYHFFASKQPLDKGSDRKQLLDTSQRLCKANNEHSGVTFV